MSTFMSSQFSVLYVEARGTFKLGGRLHDLKTCLVNPKYVLSQKPLFSIVNGFVQKQSNTSSVLKQNPKKKKQTSFHDSCAAHGCKVGKMHDMG